jgi:lactate racemase-like protein
VGTIGAVRRVPVISGSSVHVVEVPDDALLLAAPPPLDPIADVGAAVGEALRFPLTGPPLDALATRGGRATIVVDPSVLPLPGAPADPRQTALAAVVDELKRVGVAPTRQTVLVAGGLERRAGRHDLDVLLSPARARDFRGRVVVHDAESEALRAVDAGGAPVDVAPELIDTDLVVTVTAAETVLHGGPAALLDACGPSARRAAGATSLLEPASSDGWRSAVRIEAALARRVPLVGVSLVLDHPRPSGRHAGWPWDAAVVEKLARSPHRRVHNWLPGALRRALLRAVDRRLEAVAVLAGSPSVAHAEALLRGTSVRAAHLDAPVDALVVPIPWEGVHRPREAVGPLGAAAIALGLAGRLWRERSPLASDGTIVLLHGFRPRFTRTGAPFRVLYEALRDTEPGHLGEVESLAARDQRAIGAYRAGRAPHPLLPFADWSSCAPMLAQAGRVIVGGCRDGAAARRLGFIPSHSPQAALEMALGVAGDGARVGVLLAPPYPPLVVG